MPLLKLEEKKNKKLMEIFNKLLAKNIRPEKALKKAKKIIGGKNAKV